MKTFGMWFKHESEAKKVVAHDPSGLYPDLLVRVSFARADATAIVDAVKRGKYKIVPSTHPQGGEGFDLVIFY